MKQHDTEFNEPRACVFNQKSIIEMMTMDIVLRNELVEQFFQRLTLFYTSLRS